jgi:hypothetical protein
MVFHEITPEHRHAVDNPRELNAGLVDAYQTRRVLDRLYGYEVSPVLWKKVMPRLSAGRVQSVATRLVVARERERIAFRAARYWDLQAVFARADGTADEGASSFPAGLVAVDGRRVAQGRDFAPSGELRNPEVLYLEGAATNGSPATVNGTALNGTTSHGDGIPGGVVHRLSAAELADRSRRRFRSSVGVPPGAYGVPPPPPAEASASRLLGQVHGVGGGS